MRVLLWVPLVVGVSVVPAAADRIDLSSLAELEATGIGPRIFHREQTGWTDGRYDDGSVARGGLYGFFPEWFSDVYFNGTLYTYAYGVTEVICGCGNDYVFFGDADLIGGELLGATLGDRWGAINEPYGQEGAHAHFFELIQTARGLTFESPEVAWFYLQSPRAPADAFGRLTARSTIYDGSGEGKPRLFYTMGMDVPVPAPIPEPGTFVLLTTGLAAALAQRRHRKPKV